MTRPVFILLALAATLAVAPAFRRGSTQAAPPKGATVRISIQKMRFVPPTAAVRVGDTVVWTNNDQHDHALLGADDAFASGPLSPGETFSYKPTRPGTLDYRCTLHPRMRGALRVR